ncbi:hypothetical protein Tco_0501993 [Tanacetum coccineum]
MPKVLLLAWDRVSKIKDAFGDKQYKPEDIQELFRKLLNDVQNIHEELAEYINTPSWNRPIVYYDDDDDEDYTIAITPILSTEEPVDSLIIEDEHLDPIPATESDKVINSSVEDLVLIPKEVKDFDLENGEIDTDILLTIKDDIIREKLLNINLLIAKIEALKDNPTPSSDFVTKSPSTFPNSFLEETDTSDNSLLESETFCFNLEEKSNGNPTSYTDLSFPDYEAFFCDSEPDLGDFTMDVVEDIFDNPTREPRVHVPNVLPTHPTLHLDSDFTLSMIDTLLPFSSNNEDNVFNPGILASNEEKSPPSSSHRGFKASKLFHHKTPMLIHGENNPILDVPFLHLYPP